MISTEKTRKHFTKLTIVKKILATLRQVLIGQVRKSIRRMPWHWEPTKDVTSCDKLR